jgi:4-hydroxybenzoate polyprenyltransferase
MKDRLLAYAQLVRLPNVFTAFADILMAGCVIHVWPITGFLLCASGCLYWSGMVFNDYFDRKEDTKTQEFRPIPSGRVSATSALFLAISLMLAGIVFAVLGSYFYLNTTLSASVFYSNTVLTAAGLAVAILVYDIWLKHSFIGPVSMGFCRFLNVLLGLSCGVVDTSLMFHLAAITGLYITGVTWFARTEETESKKWSLISSAVIILGSLLLALAVPLHLKSSPIYYLGIPIIRAITKPNPKHVQQSVKRCILGLILLNAILASAFVGWPGLLIILLFVPAMLIGKWVYST